MKHWRELEVAALLGSQKAATINSWPADESGELAQQLGQQPQAILKQLALLAIYQRAGLQPRTLPPQPAAHLDNQPYATAAQAKHLSYVLGNDGQGYLPDWLNYARERQVLLPRRYLPAVLKLGDTNKKWRLAIAAVAGERGDWLAQQNPDWAWLSAARFDLGSPELEPYWQSASLPCRELLFERLRAQNPSQALVFLQKIWPEENAATRKLLLDKLLANLSMADQDFLESCLDDRSKAVKEAAVDLLARLPESALVQRMQAVATETLHIKQGMILKSVDIIPLEQLNPALERDGLDAKAKKVDNLGEKAQWLRDVFACVSLDWLTHYSGMSADNLLAKILKSEWAAALYSGLLIAAKRQQHQDWLIALLHADSVKIPANTYDILPVLTQQRREEHVLDLLVAGKKSAAALKELVGLLNSVPLWSWSADFTLKLLESYQTLTRGNAPLSYEFEHRVFPQLLTLIGRCGDPALGLQPNLYPQQILSNWQFRRDLQSAFAE